MQPVTQKRFQALDVFRGLTLCFMIIVNTSGNGATTYPMLKHAGWNGFTPTDLVFPSFLFAVGNAMSFVMKKWENKSVNDVLYIIFKRTFIIFLLGFLMYWFPFFSLDKSRHIISFPFSDTRIFGVLQRIALCYCFASLLIYFLKPKATLIICGIVLLLYWIVMKRFGDLTMTGNPERKIDLFLLGEKHMYHGEGLAFDPEGLLSTFPAITNVVAGYVAGQFVQLKGKTYEGLVKLMLTGFALFAIAYCWNTVFPVNKKIWTSSFVLLTIGLDCLILASVIYLIDFRNYKTGVKFFEVFGKNPLIIYLLSELLVTVLFMISINGKPLYTWIYQNIFQWMGDYFGAFIFSVMYMLLCWSVAYLMNKKKIYIRV